MNRYPAAEKFLPVAPVRAAVVDADLLVEAFALALGVYILKIV